MLAVPPLQTSSPTRSPERQPIDLTRRARRCCVSGVALARPGEMADGPSGEVTGAVHSVPRRRAATRCRERLTTGFMSPILSSPI